MDAFTLVAKLVLDKEEFDKGLEEVEKNGESGASGVGTTVAKVAKVATKAAADFLESAVKTGMTFDAMMSKVQALSGAEGAEFQALRDKAQELGLTTKFTATEVATAMGYMGMAGWKTEDMLDGIGGVMSLAAASGEDLAKVSDIVTDSLTAFGLTAKDTQHYVDVLAAAATNSNTTVAQMGQAFKFVAPLAGQLGYSIDDVAVAMGLMANAGIKSSMAGTSLRNILQHLFDPNGPQAAALKEFGISLTDANGRMKSFGEVMQDFRTVAKEQGFDVKKLSEDFGKLDKLLEEGKITEEQYNETTKKLTEGNSDFLATVADLAGTRSLPALLTLMNATDEEFAKLQHAIDNSSGAAQRMAETMNDNLQGDIVLLNSALDGLKLLVSDEFSGQLRTLVQDLTGGLQGLSKVLKYGFGVDTGVADLERGFEAAEGRADKALKQAALDELKAKSLYDQLVEMQEGAKGSSEKLAEWQRVAKDLIGLCPELSQNINLVNGSFIGDQEAIEKSIEQMGQRARVMALQNLMSEKAAALVKANEEELSRRTETVLKRSDYEAATQLAVREANNLLKKYKITEFESSDENRNKFTATTAKTAYDAAHAFEALYEAAKQAGDQDMMDALDNLEEYKDLALNSKKAYEEASAAQQNMTSALQSAQDEYASSCEAINSMIDEITGYGTAVNSLPTEHTVTITTNYVTNGSAPDVPGHAKGDWNVPYDNYMARLHRGEMVLTASQARKYRDGETGSGISTSDIASAMRSAVMSLTMELNSVTVGRVVGDATTARVNNNISNVNRRKRYGVGG